jgi:hypothetical protein
MRAFAGLLGLSLVFLTSDHIYGAETFFGVLFNSTNAPLVQIDATTGATSVVGLSGFGGLNSLSADSNGRLFAAGGLNQLVELNTTTGVGTAVGTLNMGAESPDIRALAFSTSGTLYAIQNTGNSSTTTIDELWTIDVTTGQTTFVGPTNRTGIQGMDFAPDGTLYGWDVGVTVGLVTINPVTGAARDVNGAVGGSTGIQTLAFSPEGVLFGGREQLFTVNPSTGSTTLVGSLGGDVRGFDFIPEPSAAAAIILLIPIVRARRCRRGRLV